MPLNRTDLKALRSMISEAHGILATTKLPEGRAERAYELLTSAVALADALLETPLAAILGAKGGTKTAERGPEYYREIAAKRKTHGGGRPRKES